MEELLAKEVAETGSRRTTAKTEREANFQIGIFPMHLLENDEDKPLKLH